MKVLFFYILDENLSNLQKINNLILDIKNIYLDICIVYEKNFNQEEIKKYFPNLNLFLFKTEINNKRFKLFEILKNFFNFYKKYDNIIHVNSNILNVDISIFNYLKYPFIVLDNEFKKEYAIDFFVFKPQYNFFNKYNYFFLNKKDGVINFNSENVLFYNMLDFFNIPIYKIKNNRIIVKN